MTNIVYRLGRRRLAADEQQEKWPFGATILALAVFNGACWLGIALLIFWPF